MAPPEIIDVDDFSPEPDVRITEIRVPRKRLPLSLQSKDTRRRAAKRPLQREEIDLTFDSDEHEETLRVPEARANNLGGRNTKHAARPPQGPIASSSSQSPRPSNTSLPASKKLIYVPKHQAELWSRTGIYPKSSNKPSSSRPEGNGSSNSRSRDARDATDDARNRVRIVPSNQVQRPRPLNGTPQQPHIHLNHVKPRSLTPQRPSKRKREKAKLDAHRECIVIDDSDDDLTTVVEQSAKRQKLDQSPNEHWEVVFDEESLPEVTFEQESVLEDDYKQESHNGREEDEDEDEEWDLYHTGFDIIHGSSWKPSTVPLVEPPDAADNLSDTINHLSLVEPKLPGFAKLHKKLRIRPLDIPAPKDRPFPWADGLRQNYKYPPRCGPTLFTGMRQLRMYGRRTRGLPAEVGTTSGLEYLPQVYNICNAPGSVNRILQLPGVVVSCSAVPAGGVDLRDEQESLPSSNVDGALSVWRRGELHKIHAHRSIRKWNENTYKWYTINDIQWDLSQQTPSVFASSGNDGFVRLWDINRIFKPIRRKPSELDGSHGQLGHNSKSSCLCMNRSDFQHECVAWHSFHGAIPLDLAFRPGSKELAVACSNGNLVVLRDPYNMEADTTLEIDFASRQKHCAGAIIWGRGPTSGFIFASSESPNGDSTGIHIACDIQKGRRGVRKLFSASESGDAMAIDPTGKILALFTAKDDSYHRLRLYDVANKDYRSPMQTIDLEKFDKTHQDEVTRAVFSPDSIYLAVARSDDSCHVYDSRYLSRGPLHQFKHKGESRASVARDTYGITEVQFVDSRFGSQLYLVTGGTDGCVRLWDLFKADNDRSNGKIIAQSDYNVGTFSIGHPADGFLNIILGDCGGQVRMFKPGQGFDE